MKSIARPGISLLLTKLEVSQERLRALVLAATTEHYHVCRVHCAILGGDALLAQ